LFTTAELVALSRIYFILRKKVIFGENNKGNERNFQLALNFFPCNLESFIDALCTTTRLFYTSDVSPNGPL
jgi:hypothetical protein